ncbi:MAG TPA: hypothetical protein VMU37_01770 [Caulobacteraceae bacterium]|nr:hypothetical protein [Caulobacteraceae bacterium]
MRRLLAPFLAAGLLFAGQAAAKPVPGAVQQYKFDTKGVCHDASGAVVKRSLCGVLPRRCRAHGTNRFHECENPSGVLPSSAAGPG